MNKKPSQSGSEACAGQPDPAPMSRAESIPIPPLLLESDEPPAPLPAGPGEKFVLTPQPAAESTGPSPGQLPEAYGTGRLLLLARDPHWLYVHWDLTKQQQRVYNAASSDRHLIVRVHTEPAGDQPAAEVHVHPESRHWFVEVQQAGAQYTAQLGYYDQAKTWTTVATSPAVATPPDKRSSDKTTHFVATPAPPPTFAQLAAAAPDWIPSPLPEMGQAIVAGPQLDFPETGHPGAPAPASGERIVPPLVGWIPILEVEERGPQSEAHTWTEAKAQALEEMFRHAPEITPSSAGLPGEMAEEFLFAPNVSSELGGPPAGPAGFWFNINAELVVYGATEPSASVQIGGQPVGLRPDGTFSIRVALPDGTFNLPVTAHSITGELRRADLQFSRRTETQGEVGAQPPGDSNSPACE